MRLSGPEFADRLGVGRRTVDAWAEKPDTVPRVEIQRALDTLLQRAGDEQRSRFDALAGDVVARPTDGAVRSQREWLAERRRISPHRGTLARAVARLYPEPVQLGDTGLIAPSSWLPSAPVDLADVRLTWREVERPQITGRHAETRDLRPLADDGRPYSAYHRAVRDLDRPRLFDNRLSYRLLGVPSTSSAPALDVGGMCYFDGPVDVGEPLLHEAGRAALDAGGAFDPSRLTWERLPFRRLVGDPFDLDRHPVLLSVSTLTVRRSPAGATFLMLRRDPAKVAIAGGMMSVIPTGVFQPASVTPSPASQDFDLWRNVMREYSEELLGNPEHDGDGPPVDYAAEPFRSLDAARRMGRIRVWFLGVALDASNLVADVLTVAVFDGDTHDAFFDGVADANDEGEIALAYPFDADAVDRLLATEQVAPSGAGCLRLALKHRDAVLADEVQISRSVGMDA